MNTDGATALIRYTAACRAVAECRTVDEAKDLRDKAMRACAHQAKNRDLEIDAAEIRMRAERKLRGAGDFYIGGARSGVSAFARSSSSTLQQIITLLLAVDHVR